MPHSIQSKSRSIENSSNNAFKSAAVPQATTRVVHHQVDNDQSSLVVEQTVNVQGQRRMELLQHLPNEQVNRQAFKFDKVFSQHAD